MKCSPQGRQHIRESEGCVLKAYQDQAGVWTIGVGHTRYAKEGMIIDTVKADQLLSLDLLESERAVNVHAKVPLTQSQFDALVSFVFNLGTGSLKKSTLLKKVNEKDYKGAAGEFMKWTKIRINGKLTESRGLTIRRNKERLMFLEGIV